MSVRICSYNIEWFDKLFDNDNRMLTDEASKKRLNAIATVIQFIDPDILGIVEAPNHKKNESKQTVKCLENFATQFSLRLRSAMIGIPSAGEQEIALLYDPSIVNVEHKPGGQGKRNPPFNEWFEFDTDLDRIKELYKMFRPPLEAKLTIINSGKSFNLMVVHAKSKGIFSASDIVHWERENMRNRRKLQAECSWIRRRVDEWLDHGNEVVVMGDINDGPGMDHYEMQFGKSSVEIIMGNLYNPERILKSHIGEPKWGSYGWKPSSTNFKDRMTGDKVNVLIDHILVSKNLEVKEGFHLIWNPYQNDIAKPIKEELIEASDHFPVSIDLV